MFGTQNKHVTPTRMHPGSGSDTDSDKYAAPNCAASEAAQAIVKSIWNLTESHGSSHRKAVTRCEHLVCVRLTPRFAEVSDFTTFLL